MKKIVSLFAVLVMLISITATSAMAAGKSGKLSGIEGFQYENLVVSPSGGSFKDTDLIPWECSGTFSNEKLQGALGTIGSLFNTELYTFSEVFLELYKLEANYYGELTVETYHSTLFSQSYNKKKSVSFSKSGTMKLKEGKYRLVLKADYNCGDYTVCKYDFTVYRKEPSYCTVNILYKYDDGTVFKRDTKKLSAGTHTIENDFYDSSVTLISSSSRQITVDSNGNGSLSTVEFVFKKNKNNNNSSNSSNNNSSNNNPSNNNSTNVGSSSSVHDIGIPNLNGRTYYEGDMNIAVLWVQQQMKQTGRYYQNDGSRWDVTGNLGDHTMEEIARFMQDNGYRNHDGHVDQTVINTFASYLGNNVSPVLVGGFYDKMDTIMIGGSAGSMKRIDKNSSSTSIKWVQCCLSKLGYYHGSINGRFDSATISAVHAFQEYAGFVERDYVTLGVARDMVLFCNNRGCDLSDLP